MFTHELDVFLILGRLWQIISVS